MSRNLLASSFTLSCRVDVPIFRCKWAFPHIPWNQRKLWEIFLRLSLFVENKCSSRWRSSSSEDDYSVKWQAAVRWKDFIMPASIGSVFHSPWLAISSISIEFKRDLLIPQKQNALMERRRMLPGQIRPIMREGSSFHFIWSHSEQLTVFEAVWAASSNRNRVWL